MQEQKLPSAIYVGLWPLNSAHDPALDELGIPDGTAIYGLFDQSYAKYAAPDNIAGLTAVSSLNKLKQDNWCAVHASSGFNYIFVKTTDPSGLTVEMKEIPSRVSDIKTYKLTIPATRFIGKKYGEMDRTNGTFGAKWDEFFVNGWFSVIENSPGYIKRYIDDCGWYEDSESYAGLMRWKEGEPFQYWVGIFCAPDTVVPEGFNFVDFPESSIGDCVIYAPPAEIYGQDDFVMKCFTKNGIDSKPNADGEWWWFERETGTNNIIDKDGCRILEHCYFLNV